MVERRDSSPSGPRAGFPFARVPPARWNDWRWQYANRLSGPEGLERLGWLRPGQRRALSRVLAAFPWTATPYYLSLISPADPADPIRRQVIPLPDELEDPASGSLDPLREVTHTLAPGLIRRFPDRAVLLVTNNCGVYCRYCFRKRIWTQRPWLVNAASLEAACARLSADRGIRELILSGGDPLTLPDTRLDWLLGRLRKVSGLELIRIGTRLPVVLPQRITPDLCRLLGKHAPVWLVTQFNHPREITAEAEAACDLLLRAGVPVDNQAVLLRGVNDDHATLASLCRGLLRIRVRPYYLHQCDRVAGAEHFRTPLETGTAIIREMQGKVSGLALPRFVVDLPGAGGKVSLQTGAVLSRRGRGTRLRGNDGKTYLYADPKPRG